MEVRSCSIRQAFSSSAATLALRAGRPALSSVERQLDQAQGLDALLVAALGALLEVGDPLLQALQVGQHQLGLDGLQVGERIDLALDVGDVVVDEAAGDEGHGVAVADVGQELVAQALALGRAAHQAGDVDEVDPRRDDLLGRDDRGQHVQARLRHRHVADVGLDGAERIVGGLGRGGLGQRVEQGRLADVGQADDGDFQGHGTRGFTKGPADLARIAASAAKGSRADRPSRPAPGA